MHPSRSPTDTADRPLDSLPAAGEPHARAGVGGALPPHLTWVEPTICGRCGCAYLPAAPSHACVVVPPAARDEWLTQCRSCKGSGVEITSDGEIPCADCDGTGGPLWVAMRKEEP